MTLFYCVHPLSQKELMKILELSAGMVSQGLSELGRFGLVSTTRFSERRETFYVTERNLAKATSSLLGRREDRIIDRVIERVEVVKLHMSSQPHDSKVAKARLQGLEEVIVVLQLAKSVLAIFETFSTYSYHAMKLGIKALMQLRVADLPQWLVPRRPKAGGTKPADLEGNND